MKKVFVDDTFIYSITSSGISVIDVSTNQPYYLIPNNGVYNTIWGDNNYVFVGSSGGLFTFPKYYPELISVYLQYPFISSNDVQHIHGNINRLFCCTSTGLDIIRRDSHYVTHCLISETTKCFVTPENEYYYLVGNTVNKLFGNSSDWSVPDLLYTTSSGFLSGVSEITDIHVTSNTSTSGSNTLFVSTNSGIYIYDEFSEDYYVFYHDAPEISNRFLTVDTDYTASMNSGNMYITSTGIGANFSVVDLYNKSVIDSYMVNRYGRYNCTLAQEDIVSISVNI